MKITINIKREYFYLVAVIIGIVFSIFLSDAYNPNLPSHPISQISDAAGNPIDDDNGNFDPLRFSAANAIKAGYSTGLNNYSYGISDNQYINFDIHGKVVFWEGDFNTADPTNQINNIRLCYYWYFPRENGCLSSVKNCEPTSTQLTYNSASNSCLENMCNRLCKGAVACNGNLAPDNGVCNNANTKVNFNRGSCSNPECNFNAQYTFNTCYCTCNLDNSFSYNQIHQNTLKRCKVFFKSP